VTVPSAGRALFLVEDISGRAIDGKEIYLGQAVGGSSSCILNSGCKNTRGRFICVSEKQSTHVRPRLDPMGDGAPSCARRGRT
jgi:hypothetical protein